MFARDDYTVWQEDRGACIAGKPRSNRFRRSPVGASVLAMNDDAVRLIDRVALIAGKHRSHRG